MKFETSTRIDPAVAQQIEGNLRKAARESKNEKFFPEGERLEVIYKADAPSVEELARRAGTEVKPLGDPTVCAIAYEAAKALCAGNPICLAIASAAYVACLKS